MADKAKKLEVLTWKKGWTIFAVCWVMVEPPATTCPACRLVSAARTSSRRRRFLWPAASAAAAIAIVSGVAIGTLGGPSADFTAKLSATSVAPTASATANIRHNGAGFRITLDAHGLPKLPAGEYYQAWLKNAAGTLVPIGTFSSSDGRVTLWSGVSPQTFSGISVTIEATDGDQGSSGRRVLTGETHQR